MKKYVCSICGYVYSEDAGIPKDGIPAGTSWEELPKEWTCPLCGAAKADFSEQKEISRAAMPEDLPEEDSIDALQELSFGQLSALFSNLAKGCEKQYLPEESELFLRLAEYYKGKVHPFEDNSLSSLVELMEKDINSGIPMSNRLAERESDRGSLRALVWGEKVTRMLLSHLKKYESEGEALLQHTKIYFCEICGFIYIGDELLDICPVCKVPNTKITQIERGK